MSRSGAHVDHFFVTTLFQQTAMRLLINCGYVDSKNYSGIHVRLVPSSNEPLMWQISEADCCPLNVQRYASMHWCNVDFIFGTNQHPPYSVHTPDTLYCNAERVCCDIVLQSATADIRETRRLHLDSGFRQVSCNFTHFMHYLYFCSRETFGSVLWAVTECMLFLLNSKSEFTKPILGASLDTWKI